MEGEGLLVGLERKHEVSKCKVKGVCECREGLGFVIGPSPKMIIDQMIRCMDKKIFV